MKNYIVIYIPIDCEISGLDDGKRKLSISLKEEEMKLDDLDSDSDPES